MRPQCDCAVAWLAKSRQSRSVGWGCAERDAGEREGGDGGENRGGENGAQAHGVLVAVSSPCAHARRLQSTPSRDVRHPPIEPGTVCYRLDAAQCRCRVAGCPAAPAGAITTTAPSRGDETMSTDSRAGTPATAADLVDVDAARHRLLRRRTPTRRPRPAGRVRHLAATAARLTTAFNEDHIAATTPGDLRLPHAAGHRRPLFIGRGHARALRAGLGDRARGARRQRRHGARRRRATATRRPRRSRTRSSRTTAAGAGRPRRRHRRHAVAQPARATAASSTTRRTAAPPTPTPRSGSRTAPTSCSRPGSTASGASRSSRRGGDAGAVRLPRHLRRRPAPRRRPRRDPRRPACASAPTRSAARRSLLGRDRRPARPRPDRRQPARRPAPGAFMTLDWDGKIRMDCSSPYAMASLIGRKRRRTDDRHRQRRRRRPARHRHPRRRADEPEPLPRRRHRLPVRRTGPDWPADAAIGKTLVSLVDDRPRRRAPRPARCSRCRSGFKWFVPGPARRLDRLRRRGVAPARRSCASTARCGPPTRTASCSRCSPRRSSPSTGKTPVEHYAELTARFGEPGYARDRRAGDPRGEGEARRALPGRRHRRRARRRPDHRDAHRGPRQRRADRRAQGHDRERAGSPPGRPAPRTSTRSTPSPSGAPSTWRGSRRRPGTSSPAALNG